MLSKEELEQLIGGQVSLVINETDNTGRNVNNTSTCSCDYKDAASDVTNKNTVEGCICACVR